MTPTVSRFLNLHPGLPIILGFGILILVGAGLLVLPVSTPPGKTLSLTDALFTVASVENTESTS